MKVGFVLHDLEYLWRISDQDSQTSNMNRGVVPHEAELKHVWFPHCSQAGSIVEGMKNIRVTCSM
jgi:hypothetical protein